VQNDRFIFCIFPLSKSALKPLFTEFSPFSAFLMSAFVLSFAVPLYSKPTRKDYGKSI